MYTVTGHRPKRLGLNYTERDRRLLVRFAIQTIGIYCMPRRGGFKLSILCGMALGWDQACAEAARDLRIPYIAAIPFDGQELAWPATAQRRYRELLRDASLIVTVGSRGNTSQAFKARNIYMIDRADTIIALYDGVPRGGTFHAVMYAKTQGKRVINVWEDYERQLSLSSIRPSRR